MTVIVDSVISVLLDIASAAVPEAAPLLQIIKRIEPVALPILKAAVAEGPEAFAAAKAAAPDLFKRLQEFASITKGAPADDHDVAVLAAMVVGVDPPGWTREETQRWWDRVNPAS